MAERFLIILKNQLAISRSHGLSECHCESAHHEARGSFKQNKSWISTVELLIKFVETFYLSPPIIKNTIRLT